MNQIFSRVAAVGLAFLTMNSSAQTLKEFINTALEQNYQIQILKNEEQMAPPEVAIMLRTLAVVQKHLSITRFLMGFM